MANTQEIPRERWIEFLDEFTREHQGWRVDMEVMGMDIGSQTEASSLPLQGISADVRPAGEHNVSIILGAEQNPPLTHMVPRAKRVSVARADGGRDTLEIEGGDGSKTLLRFELPRAA